MPSLLLLSTIDMLVQQARYAKEEAMRGQHLYLNPKPNAQSQKKTLSGHRKAGCFKIFAVSQGK